MKKRLVCFMLIMMALLLTACSGAQEGTGTETAASPSVAAEANTENKDVSMASIYEEIAAACVLPEMMEFPEDMVLDFYGIDASDYEDAVFYQSYDSLLADEVVLIRATDTAAADRMEELLNDRLEAKAEEAKGYSPEQYAIIEKCSVERSDCYVALIVSSERQTLVDIFKAAIA